jgi:hypothetical protein
MYVELETIDKFLSWNYGLKVVHVCNSAGATAIRRTPVRRTPVRRIPVNDTLSNSPVR